MAYEAAETNCARNVSLCPATEEVARSVATEHDGFQIAVLVNWVEYKKQKMIISGGMPFYICYLF
jgi:hypothetical protein